MFPCRFGFFLFAFTKDKVIKVEFKESCLLDIVICLFVFFTLNSVICNLFFKKSNSRRFCVIFARANLRGARDTNYPLNDITIGARI